MSRLLRDLKGVGEKTEKLFAKLGITDVEDLIHYYPRNYDAYQEPVAIENLEENSISAVCGTLLNAVSVSPARKVQVISVTIGDRTGTLPVAWFNMPFLRNVLKKGSTLIFRGRAVKKKGKLVMEHPEIFTPASYQEVLHSLQPIYGLTAGLSNKTVTKLVRQVLEEKNLDFGIFPKNSGRDFTLRTVIMQFRRFISRPICRNFSQPGNALYLMNFFFLFLQYRC